MTIAGECDDRGGAGGLEVHNEKGVAFKNVEVTTKTGEAFVIKDAEVNGLPTAAK